MRALAARFARNRDVFLRERDLAMTHEYQEPYAARPQVLTAGRAVIGDELRAVAAWCELGECIARYADPSALGYADIVAQALAAGWCKDGFGRLVCPSCQQRFPIWSSAPLVPHARMPGPPIGQPVRYVGQHRLRAAASRAARLGGGLRAPVSGKSGIGDEGRQVGTGWPGAERAAEHA